MKFNYKKYITAKDNKLIEDGHINTGEDFDNDHIDRRIEDQRGDVPNEVQEGQLEDCRVNVTEDIMEKKLDKVRTGQVETLTEDQLDSCKSKMCKMRNPSAYEGDINKVEEQRLESNYVAEKEPYKSANEEPEQFRWWKEKSPDGLKLAKKEEEIKTAQYSPAYAPTDTKEWGDVEDFFSDDEGVISDIGNVDLDEGVDGDFISDVEEDLTMEIDKFVENPNLPMLYVSISFDPDDFGGDKLKILTNALKLIKEENPDIGESLDISDLAVEYKRDDTSGENYGYVRVRKTGEDAEALFGEDDAEFVEEEMLNEIEFEVNEGGGTPVVTGILKANLPLGDYSEDEVISAALRKIKDLHPELAPYVSEEILELSNSEDYIMYTVSPPENIDLPTDDEPDEPVEEPDFFEIAIQEEEPNATQDFSTTSAFPITSDSNDKVIEAQKKTT